MQTLSLPSPPLVRGDKGEEETRFTPTLCLPHQRLCRNIGEHVFCHFDRREKSEIQATYRIKISRLSPRNDIATQPLKGRDF